MKDVWKRAVAASTFLAAALLSFGWSDQGGVSLSVENAQARVGRPLTPVSAAGVARRQARRGLYGASAAFGMAPPVAGGPYYGPSYYSYSGNPYSSFGNPERLQGGSQ